MSHLGEFFRIERHKRGLTLGQLARLIGYRNVNKGSNKICRFERDGIIKEDLLVKLVDALGIDFPTIERLIEEDRKERLRKWTDWVNEPVPMCLVVRIMAAVYRKVPFPPEIITHEQAEAFACDYAKQNHLKVCLVLSRRHSVWINGQGVVESRTESTPDETNVPFMQVGGKRFLLG